jgi:hypothetical protein
MKSDIPQSQHRESARDLEIHTLLRQIVREIGAPVATIRGGVEQIAATAVNHNSCAT